MKKWEIIWRDGNKTIFIGNVIYRHNSLTFLFNERGEKFISFWDDEIKSFKLLLEWEWS